MVAKISLGAGQDGDRSEGALKKKKKTCSTGKYEVVDINCVLVNILAKNLINSIF
jgi:hypothetical protein